MSARAVDHPDGRADNGVPGPATAPTATSRAVPPEPGATTPVISGLPEVTRALGIALGSTTALSAIMFYFGWSRAFYFYEYFGVDSSLLGLSFQDYLQLSVDGLFVPLAIAAPVTLALLWARPLLGLLIQGRRRIAIARVARPLAGLLLLLNGLSAIFVRTPLNRSLLTAPLCLAGGAALLVLTLRGLRGAAPTAVAVTEWTVITVLVGLSLFWAANDYSAAVGRSRAQDLAAQLPAFPDATLYSEKSLSLRHSGVQETRCTDKEASYAFRYRGLKLILQSGDQYLFLPATWSPADGVAVLMPRTDATRLEFSRSDSIAPTSPAC
jgi:hypothetical protein